MRSRLAALLLVGAGVVAALGAGVLLGRGGRETAPVPSAAASTSAPEPGPRTPALAGAGLDGAELGLEQLAGRAVVVNVWASWCVLCAQEAPAFALFEAEHPEAAVLGIAYEDSAADARRFSERFSWKHPSLLDPEGRLAARLALLDLPTTIFLSRDHRIVWRVTGPAGLAELESGYARARRAP